MVKLSREKNERRAESSTRPNSFFERNELRFFGVGRAGVARAFVGISHVSIAHVLVSSIRIAHVAVIHVAHVGIARRSGIGRRGGIADRRCSVARCRRGGSVGGGIRVRHIRVISTAAARPECSHGKQGKKS